ncbi:MAG: hypothetical protein M3N51_02115 [Actinomycetota bacterium]|nr:hypothetical protein [Actinomycetota bacterium]
MSQEHKDALAQGRRESRAVKRYLEAIGSKKRGRPVSSDRLQEKLDNLEKRIEMESDPLKRVELHQQRIDAADDLKSAGKVAQLDELERSFVEVAKGYSERRGISYSAWREEGVPAEVLRRAGIPRTRRRS